MLFAISGSQGSGKTTVINELKKRGYPIVERKTSRSILEEWGVTLSQVNNDRDLTIRFQDRILTRKMEDEREAVEDVSRIWFTERTYADLFTYALIAIGKDNEYSDWVDEYFKDCAAQQCNYNANFYLPSGRFQLEHDGVRGSNQHYSRMVDITMKDVLSRMGQSTGLDPDTFKPRGTVTVDIDRIDVDGRVDQILEHISKYI
jgi:predicted ATPase